MGTITLAEAVKLKSILTKKVHELSSELQRVAFVQVEKGEEPKPSKRLLTEVDTELEDVRKDIRILDKLVYRANIDHILAGFVNTIFNGFDKSQISWKKGTSNLIIGFIL
ncbi:hypothetical protein MHH85_02245 [Viridibacillus sp. FSL E2-0187]|uniref:hypothetical protein n=1 Tax=Viridibacillus sp. FSL E2-0187 TaxID=2921362 RepID=UPI0030F62ACF